MFSNKLPALWITALFLFKFSHGQGFQPACIDTYGLDFCVTYLSQVCSTDFNNCRRTCGLCSAATQPPLSGWSQWGLLGICSVTCGTGTRIRYRDCLVAACLGASSEVQQCSLSPCPAARCEDLVDPSVCAVFSSQGQCDQVTTQCRRTCGFCFAVTTPSPTIPIQIKADCRDVSDTCAGFKTSGYCTTDSNVRRVCEFTCGVCRKPVVTVPTTPVGWSNWGFYETCSTTCGPGAQKKTRRCLGKKSCIGSADSWRSCSIRKCFSVTQPIQKWSEWGSYGSCSVTCGRGRRIRRRECAGSGCTGSAISENDCILTSCQQDVCRDVAPTCASVIRNSPQLCSTNDAVRAQCRASCGLCSISAWSPWTKYGPCQPACGQGFKKRFRQCLNGNSCPGSSQMSASCQNRCRNPAIKPAKWGRWTQFSPCSAKCGGGTQTRRRACKSSRNCSGPSSTTRRCNIDICRTEESSWGSWGPSGKCSKTCGPGVAVRRRTCKAKKCVGPYTKKAQCRVKLCSASTGKWAAWGLYGPCSVTCGRGKKRRTRICIGRDCPGNFAFVANCVVGKCQTVSAWGPWSSPGACTKTCGGGLRNRSRQCRGFGCKGSATKNERCNIQLCSSASTWGPWSSAVCSNSCGGGTLIRRRQCRGAGCKGSSTKQEKCNLNTCPSVGGAASWSTCTKSCGVGTRYKFKSTSCISLGNPRCERTFEECNRSPCPRPSQCLNGYEFRRGIQHECCKSVKIRSRVLGGRLAKITEWPWMVFVLSGVEICGGTLIHQQWVLTAAHCIRGETSKIPLKQIKVHVGIETLSTKSSANLYTVIKSITHENYNDKKIENDIALLKLSKPTISTRFSSPISLPKGEETPTDTTCFATGWGLTNPAVLKPSDPLMEVDLQNLDVGVCRKAYGKDAAVGNYVKFSNKILCAGSLSKRNDVCQGDSGGPLVCQRCSSCEWYVAGITSFGPAETCGKIGFPGVYTRVTKFENWIHSHISDLKRSSSVRCPQKYGP